MAKKKRNISISLAAKCQLLFGLAVLVIIAGALAVPWQRMEQLAGQPNMKAARVAADMHFREIHLGAATRPPPTSATQPAATSPATTAPFPLWNEITLTDADYPRPRIYIAPSAISDFLPDREAGQDPIAVKALKAFRARQQETEFGSVVTVADKTGEKSR